MRIKLKTLAALALLLGFAGPEGEIGAQPAPSARFPEASVRFEQNATDADFEVVFDVGGTAEGLSKLVVRSPDGRTVIEFAAPDGSTLGIRTFRFESPEPRDVASLKAAYPEGVYTFSGATVSGVQLHGESQLSHTLPPTVSFTQPSPEAEDVDTEKLEIVWRAVSGVAAYLIEIEDEERGTGINARLPASVARFVVPNGFLRDDTEYALSVGTESPDGNRSFVETSFATAGEEDEE